MFLTLQHPLTDLRNIIPNNQRLKKPQWPIPDEDSSLRHFGVVVPRPLGGIHDWPGEQVFCLSRKAIRIQQLTQQKLRYQGNWLGFEGVFRRFYSTGRFMGKFEIGMTHPADEFANEDIMSEDAMTQDAITQDTAKPLTGLFEATIRSFLELKVFFQISKTDQEQSQLYDAGASLAKLYLRGSTKRKYIPQVQPWWIKPGKPLLLAVFEDLSHLELPPYTIKQQEFKEHNITLYSLLYPIRKNKRIKCWFIGIHAQDDTASSRAFIRHLRINLLRINAEKEALRHVLNEINTGAHPITDEDSRHSLAAYLEDATTKLLRKVRFGINQSDILDHALYNEDAAAPGELESLLSQLEPLKNKFIQDNLKKLGNTYNLIGNFEHVNIATKIDNNGQSITKVDTNVENKGEIGQFNTTEDGDIITTKK